MRVLGLFTAFFLFAQTASAGFIYDQYNGPPGPGFFFWLPSDIGWYWTPQDNVELEGIQTQLSSAKFLTLPPTGHVYDNDFQEGIGAEWDAGRVETSPNGRRRFMGLCRNELVVLKLIELPPHQSVSLHFDLLIIGSWDGQGDLSIPGSSDDFTVDFDGKCVLNHSFTNRDGVPTRISTHYPDAVMPRLPKTTLSERNTLGYGGEGDSTWHVDVEFAHLSQEIELNFMGHVDQIVDQMGLGLEDECWGIDNVVVRTH